MGNLLLLSPFDGLSHRFWREGLAKKLGESFEVTQVSLPARYFAWRHRGNSLSLARHPEIDGDWDLVIATSMTDLSALRGMSRALRHVPVILYFHENQFAYPGETLGRVERQITSIYSALSADRVVFNSDFNRRTFLEGAAELLKKMPDEVPPGVDEELATKATVIPVALGLEVAEAFNRVETPLRIVWNHRWEHDKGPDQLLAIVNGLIEKGFSFRLSLMGEQFRETPPEITALIDVLRRNKCLGELGHVESRDDYLWILKSHHVVLSTAYQEFQGLSVMEGMACGCLPVTPNDLSYPEYVPEALRYRNLEDAIRILTNLGDISSSGTLSPQLDAYDWARVLPAWQKLITDVV